MPDDTSIPRTDHKDNRDRPPTLDDLRVHVPPENGTEPTSEPVFKPLTLGELRNREPKEWLVQNVIGKGDIAMIVSPPGQGKTFASHDLAFSACLGRQWAGRFDIPVPLAVAYCAGEGIGGLPQRFEAAAQHYGVDDLDNLFIFETVPQLFDIHNPEHAKRFVDDWLATGKPLDLLIIDTLHSATAGADENSAKDMGNVLQAVKFIRLSLGCAVLLDHHTNKAGTAERGSSALRGALDTLIEIQAAGTKYVMNCEKLKDGERWKSQTFDLVTLGESARVWWDDPADKAEVDRRKTQTRGEILSLLREDPSRPLTSAQIASALGISQQNANKVLAALVKDHAVLRRAHEGRSQWEWVLNGLEPGL